MSKDGENSLEEEKLNNPANLPCSNSNEGKLSFFQKFCYGIGGISYQITVNSIGLYLPIFLLEIAQVFDLFSFSAKF